MTPPLPPLPPGRHAVAVSGGADSVALLHLLLQHHPRAHFHVIHFNHQTRCVQSDEDATLVTDLAKRLNLPCTTARRSDLEPALAGLPANPSARYRALRLCFYRTACHDHRLDSVLLGHHADDQAETLLHRLLRGSGPPGLTGMSPDSRHADLRLLRPLLSIRRQTLRDYLHSIGAAWREDPSNASDDYLRNRLRKLLAAHPELTTPLLDLAPAAVALRDWVQSAAPVLPVSFPVRALHTPSALARESARRWLLSHDLPASELELPVLDRLIHLATDAASPPTLNLPTRRVARRRAGFISIDAG